MAFKQVAYADEVPQDIILEIDGLIANSDGTFVLQGVKPFQFGVPTIDHMVMNLTDQGIDRRFAERLVDDAIGDMSTKILAHAIAQRTKRIG